MACQLEFFSSSEQSEIDCLKADVKVCKESNDKVRKSMFARHSELARKYTELHDRLQILERNICLGVVTMSLRS